MKNFVPILIIFAVVGVGAWFLGRQLNPRGIHASATSSESSSGKILPLPKLPKPASMPPAHEKAFLEEKLKTNPNHAPILLRLGEVERSMGEYADARTNLEKALKSDPSLIDARLELSLVYYQLKDVDNAERQNLLVLKQNPKQPDALYNLGAIEANRGQFVQARDYWQRAVQAAPDTPSGSNAAAALTKLSPRGHP